MYECFIAVGIFVVGFVIYGIIQERYLRRRTEKIFTGRDEKTPVDFYAAYFRPDDVSFDIVNRVFRLLEEHLDYDLSRLSAADDFSKNLGIFVEIDSMFEEELILLLNEEFDIEITDAEGWDLMKAFSVRDIVNLVNRKVHGDTTV